MEEVISRFSHIAQEIFEKLDNYHFIQCKVISQSWKNFMEENKFSYIRLIKTLTNCSKKAVKKTFPKANLEETMRLASDVTKVYNALLKENVYDPSLTLFHMASKHGYLSVCQLILDGIEGKHPKSVKRENPLHFAAENGHFSICQLIIEKNESKSQSQVNKPQDFEDIFDFDIDDNTPIHLAAQNGHLSVCELLIKWIEDAYPEETEYANAENTDGSTPLHLAAEFGHLSVCQFLVEKVEDTNQENGFDVTPLNYAVKNCHPAIFHVIFESIVDKRFINKGDGYGQTPLHFAAANNLLSVCQKLMEVVDDGNTENVNGYTPFHFAACSGHLDICELLMVYQPINLHPIIEGITHLKLLDYGNHKHPFYWAAGEGLVDVCKLFLEKQEEKNPANYEGYSLLHWAASNGHLEICQYIIENINDKNPADLSLYTPLHFAAQNGHLEVCQLIVNNITDKDPKNSKGETPIQLASDSGHSTLVKMLQAGLSKKIKLG